MKILAVTQGTRAWHEVRAVHQTASEAPAALGVSKYQTRSALLKQKATGLTPDVDAAKQFLYDRGHAAEATARALAEEILGTELFPITATLATAGIDLLASVDGITMDDETLWEHKLYSEALAADVRAGTLAPHYTVQMDQQLLVTGASRCLFMTSDGTADKMAWCWYETNVEKLDALIAGWQQFCADVAAHVETQPEPVAAVGKAPDTLPALRIEITGAVTASNLDEFKLTALAAIRSVNRELSTDQHFADAAKSIDWCSDVESRVAAAKEFALSQTETIDILFKALDDISAEARTVRLDLDRLVTKRKAERKDEIVLAGRKAYAEHVDALKLETEGLWINLTPPDFVAAAKNKRSFASLQDAVDVALANGKIEADASARKIRAALLCLATEGKGFEQLFADKAMLIHKPLEDLTLIIQTRIAAQKQRDAEAKEAVEAAARKTAAEAVAAAAPVVATIAAAVEIARVAAPAPADAMAPPGMSLGASLLSGGYGTSARAAPKVETLPPINNGTLCARLGFTVTTVFIKSLGFAPVDTGKVGNFWKASDFQSICAAIIAHIQKVALAKTEETAEA